MSDTPVADFLEASWARGDHLKDELYTVERPLILPVSHGRPFWDNVVIEPDGPFACSIFSTHWTPISVLTFAIARSDVMQDEA